MGRRAGPTKARRAAAPRPPAKPVRVNGENHEAKGLSLCVVIAPPSSPIGSNSAPGLPDLLYLCFAKFHLGSRVVKRS